MKEETIDALMKEKFLIIVFFILIFAEAFAQPEEEWVRRYNGSANSYDIVSKMVIDKDNNVLVFGSSNEAGSMLDFLVIKYSPDGNVIWTRSYNGSGNSFDQLNSACIDPAGNCYMTGYSTDSALQSNATTVKFDSAGNLIWARVFRKTGFTMGDGKNILLDNSGNVIVCGTLKSVTGYFDIVKIKYSPDGEELRSQTFNGPGNGDDIPVAIKADAFDNIIIAGTSKSANVDMIVIKYDSSSTLIWNRTFNGSANSDDGMSSMVLDNDNNIYFCGSIYSTPGSFDYFYAKLDKSGNILWSETYDGTGNSLDIPSYICLDQSNNVYVTGYSRNSLSIGSEDILTIKVTQDGETRWIRRYDGSTNGTDQANSIAADNNGNVYIGGTTDAGNFHLVYALLKYDSLGSFQWVKNYSYSQTPEDFIYDLALDELNNVYITGISFGTGTDFDFATIKYSQTIGINPSHSYTPDKFFLSQNYPNPFNPNTVINYKLKVTCYAVLKVFDVSGRAVITLVNAVQNAGSHDVEWDASNFPSGVYFYELRTEDFTSVKKMLLLK